MPSASGTPASTVAQGPPPHAQVIRMTTAYWVSRAVYAVARLGIGAFVSPQQKTGTHA